MPFEVELVQCDEVSFKVQYVPLGLELLLGLEGLGDYLLLLITHTFSPVSHRI
jgi:hypothetical protein